MFEGIEMVWLTIRALQQCGGGRCYPSHYEVEFAASSCRISYMKMQRFAWLMYIRKMLAISRLC